MNTKSMLQFDFIVDKEKNTITVKKEFKAGKQLVWDCHTKSELLIQWFAPKPFTAKTKSMEFKEGGRWHYAMVDPEGKEYWGLTEYTKIHPIDFYKSLDAFSDSAGKINAEMPRAEWHVQFLDKNGNTLVETTVQYAALSDLESVMQMGMQEGLTSTLERLDELLETL